MAKPSPPNSHREPEAWVKRVRQLAAQIDSRYWDDFVPVPPGELTRLEHDLNRTLPDDLRLFLTTFGSGRFPPSFGGGIYSPDDMRLACHGPLLMHLGSAGWASDEAQRTYYVSRGRDNPDPTRFTPRAVTTLGFSLLDLLQIGTDGSCGYHQVYVGEPPLPFGYCLLHESEVYDKLPSFSDGLFLTLTRHARG